MAANIVITGVTLTPNPVYAGGRYKISVEITPVTYVLGDDTASLADSDGALIEAPSES